MLAYLRGGARSDPPWMLPNMACHINVTCGLHVDAKVNMIGDAEKLLHYMVPTCSKLTVLSRVSSAYPSQISTFQMQKKCKFTDKKNTGPQIGHPKSHMSHEHQIAKSADLVKDMLVKERSFPVRERENSPARMFMFM